MRRRSGLGDISQSMTLRNGRRTIVALPTVTAPIQGATCGQRHHGHQGVRTAHGHCAQTFPSIPPLAPLRLGPI